MTGADTAFQSFVASSGFSGNIFGADYSDVSQYLTSLPELMGGNFDFSGCQAPQQTGWFGGFNFPQLQMPDFSGLKFNFTFTPASTSSSSDSSSSLSSNKNYNIDNSAVKNLSWWKQQGYNEEKGKQLAANTKKRSEALKAEGVTRQCGRGVRLGLNDTFYGGSTHYAGFGYANQTGDTDLCHDKNLKKIDVSGMHLSKEDIPAGVIVIYQSYSSGQDKDKGHIEVSDGNGHGYSDLTTTLLQNHGVRKEPKEIWIPV
jgi:hypothetical protein